MCTRGLFVIVDIHSHILPNLDDGSRNLQETKEMIDIAVQEGIEAIIATPHYEAGANQEFIVKYQQAFEEVRQYIEANQIPLELYQGNEIYYSESVPELLQKNEVHTLNGTPYILMEFPIEMGYSSIQRAVNAVSYAGYWPIIAHTERYPVLRDIKKVYELIRMGAYIQLNTNAITGKEGWRTKQFCKKLLKHHMVHVVGTDAHGSRHRRPKMKECLGYLDKKFGKTYRRRISEENPLSILKGEKIGGEN